MPDRDALEQAVGAFLNALHIDSPELSGTPARVASAWADEFLRGYRTTPREALGESSQAPSNASLVTVAHIDFTSVCPHHLLPWRGLAHVAYRPGGELAGFGRIASLVDCLARRFVLQETLGAQIADALVDELRAKGAHVVLEAEQSCMTLRGEARTRTRVWTEACAGDVSADDRAALREAIRAGGGR